MSKTITKADLTELVMRGVQMGKYNTTSDYQELQSYVTKLIENYISAEPSVPFWKKEIETLISEDCTLLAIKQLKNYTSKGLREIKAAIDVYKKTGSWDINEYGNLK